MISNDEDRPIREALETATGRRSHPVPSAWVATFRWSKDFALNQENGESTGPHWRPSVEDVERMLAE